MLAITTFCILASVSCCSSVLTTVPLSQNVTVGSEVEFSCGTNDSNLSIIWFHTSNVIAAHIREELCGGGFILKLQLTALAEYNESRYTCYLINGTSQLNSKQATLLVQGALAEVGNLYLTPNDHDFCSVRSTLSWTAPFTLDNVPILGYNVTVHSEGNLITHKIVNVTLIVLQLLHYGVYEIKVSAINQIGEGNATTISTVLLSNGTLETTLLDYYSNGKEWKLLIDLKGICVISEIVMTSFQVCQFENNCSLVSLYTNNTQLINFTTDVQNISTLMTVLLTLPENKNFSFNFTIHFITGQQQSSEAFLINTNDILAATVNMNESNGGMVCFSFTFRNNSQSIGAVVTFDNGSTNDNIIKEVYRDHNVSCCTQLCVYDIPAGIYTVSIFDLEVTPFVLSKNQTPAVVIYSVHIPGLLHSVHTCITLPSNSFADTTSMLTKSISITSLDNSLALVETMISFMATSSPTISLENNINTIIIISSGVSTVIFAGVLITLILISLCYIVKNTLRRGNAIETEEPVYVNVIVTGNLTDEVVQLEVCPAYDRVNTFR